MSVFQNMLLHVYIDRSKDYDEKQHIITLYKQSLD